MESASSVMVGRQPILDRHGRTVAYELLFRSTAQECGSGVDATTSVIVNTFLAIGQSRVLGGKKGFINFSEESLLSEQALLLPREQAGIEILETVRANGAVVRACEGLQAAGFTLVLDDVVEEVSVAPLLPHVDLVKLDMPRLSPEELERLCGYFGSRGLAVLAEKVETAVEFEAARRHGCELFQGYFFARPEIVSTGKVPSSKMACLRLISEVQRPELDFDRLEAIVKPDIGLVLRLLCFANSAALSSRLEIQTVARAFRWLGENHVRKWVTLAALPGLATGKPTELVTASLVRAKFCELAAEQAGDTTLEPASCFLAGLLSLMDVMIGRPLDELLRDMALEQGVKAVIVNQAGVYGRERQILALAVTFERSQLAWAEEMAGLIGIPAAMASRWHQEAIGWAEGLPWK